jgi:hypothetical protein
MPEEFASILKKQEKLINELTQAFVRLFLLIIFTVG